MGAPDCKIGITGSPWARLSGYQNSYSKKSHTACFDMIYVGPPRAIMLLEKTIKETLSGTGERSQGLFLDFRQESKKIG